MTKQEKWARAKELYFSYACSGYNLWLDGADDACLKCTFPSDGKRQFPQGFAVFY